MEIDEINLTDILTLIINEAINKSKIFSNFDINNILIAGAKNKTGCKKGTYSKVIPMRFRDGASIIKYNEDKYCIPRLKISGIEILYIIYFFIPSFFELDPRQKIDVIFHELFHISPDFNGDIRRIGEKKYFHGYSSEKYTELFSDESETFYKYIMGTKYSYFLQMKFKDFQEHFKKIKMRKVKKPKAVKFVKTGSHL